MSSRRFAAQGYIADRAAGHHRLPAHAPGEAAPAGGAGRRRARPSWPRSLAAATGRKFLRLQCYEGQDETKALYEWDYGKQLLYTQILREKIGQVVE